MLEIIEHIFKEFPPLQERFDTNYAITLHIIGGALIAVTFIIIGCLCAMPKYKDPEYSKRRTMLTRMFGYFLISCGLSRALDMYGIWHNYAHLTGYIKILTGLLSLMAIAYIPSVIKEMMRQREMKELNKKMTETNTKLDEIQQLTDSVDKSKDDRFTTNF